jgi:hypothetical protein
VVDIVRDAWGPFNWDAGTVAHSPITHSHGQRTRKTLLQHRQRLHALLNLTDREGIHVMLDNHGDMTGSAGCGNGVPMWFQQKIVPDLIGKPLKTELPFSLVPDLRIDALPGYAYCGDNATKWEQVREAYSVHNCRQTTHPTATHTTAATHAACTSPTVYQPTSTA